MKRRVLIMSYSPLRMDARVQRHIRTLSKLAEVTTCGYGGAPFQGEGRHFALPPGATSLPMTPAGVASLAARRYSSAILHVGAGTAALNQLGGESFDLVVANDARSLPAAVQLAKGAPLWADMHEWAPEERSQDIRWRLLVSPFMKALCLKYLPDVSLVTTVCSSIARLYDSRFGTSCHVLRNAPPYVDGIEPSVPVLGALRVVHSGAAVPGRRLEDLVAAVRRRTSPTTLDLFLLPGGDSGRYLERMRRLVDGDPRVRLRPPVPPCRLPATLRHFDVGAFVMPPINQNAYYALPNKLFDYVQARLALLVGPSPEMAHLVRSFKVGTVTANFDVSAIVRALDEMTQDRLSAAKLRSHRAAQVLNAEEEERRLLPRIQRLID